MTIAPHPRVDAVRNRDLLLSAATRAFAAAQNEPSMRAIARDAGVGIATLYRHFPTRESLVDAVYQDQVRRLITGAQDLLDSHPPATALRLWMDLFAEWLAAKHGMLDTLRAMIDSDQIAHAETRQQILTAVGSILAAGRAAREIRQDADPADITAALIGVLSVTGAPAQNAQASRLMDLIMDGLRTGR